MNLFMYAPKADAKHRANWRILYSDFEANELRLMILEAKAHGIDFCYSLSPGLDIVYSDTQELNLLLKKYDQILGLGCETFAILFDDIEPNITNDEDMDVFKNYAQAQVHVTNAVYEHLRRPKFLFCPTEYCESRASPSVANSTYLNTIGVGLNSSIDIMWSGSRVIPKYITEESIDALTKVIRRRPLIWENLHANDYDRRRVFLGPYSGRSTKLISKIRGILTNPNCEYEANYIAIHTLAQWSRCTEDLAQLNQPRFNDSSPLDKKGDRIVSSEISLSESKNCIYDPKRALIIAIQDWLPTLLEERSLPPGLDLSTQISQDHRCDEVASSQLAQVVMSNKQEVFDGVGEGNHVDMVHEDISPQLTSIASTSNKNEMDTTESPIRHSNNDNNSCDSCTMQEDLVENEAPAVELATETKSDSSNLSRIVCSASSSLEVDRTLNQNESKSNPNDFKPACISLEDLSLLVDLYYLPFEHGPIGVNLLSDIKWLRDHSDILTAKNLQDQKYSSNHQFEPMQTPNQNDNYCRETQTNENDHDHDSEQQSRELDSRIIACWIEKAEKLNELCVRINRLVNTLIYDCPNKLFSRELYPYLSEMRDAMTLIMDYLKFLRFKTSSSDRFYYSNANPNKAAKSQQVNIPICDDEPWAHRGGLIGDVQRLLS